MDQADFTNTAETCTYIQRSKSFPFPFEFYLRRGKVVNHDAFTSAIPHICRLKSLTINPNTLPNVLIRLCCQTPLLEELGVKVPPPIEPHLDHALFNEGFPLLRELRLLEVKTRFTGNFCQKSEFSSLNCISDHPEQLKFSTSFNLHPCFSSVSNFRIIRRSTLANSPPSSPKEVSPQTNPPFPHSDYPAKTLPLTRRNLTFTALSIRSDPQPGD